MAYNFNYVPIVKWKTGERTALASLTPEQKAITKPLIELVDYTVPADLLEKIEECFDVYYFDAYIDTLKIDDEERKYLVSITEEAKNRNRNLFPVLYFDDFPNTADELISKTSTFLIRIPLPEDLMGPSNSVIFETITNWHRQHPSINLDIMLDLGSIPNKKAANLLILELKNVFKEYILQSRDYKKIIIAMTCFPENISSLEAGETNSYERYEIKLFEKLLNEPPCKQIRNCLVFSDYGVTKFTDTEIDYEKLRYGVLPKIRYTTSDSYIVLKGKKDRQTNEWIKDQRALAHEVYTSNYYYGESFSFGDLEIKERALGEKGPGNNTNWVAISANHHIAVVIEELAKIHGV